MKKVILTITSFLLSLGLVGKPAQAAGVAGGLTLLETSGARVSALGESFTAAQDDITAMSYNPASLGSLSGGHTSFMYQKGLAEDSYGQLLIGSPYKAGSVGLSIGYYSGGDINLYDGSASRTVSAQKDLAVSLGMSRQFRGMNVGMSGKYLSSELAETAKASAFAADFGMNMALSDRINFGASLLNLGSQLKFVEEGDDLPRTARAGLAMNFNPAGYASTLFLDAPYNMIDQELNPSIGMEVNFGMLAIRGGYKSGQDLNEFSIGTGFMLGKSSFDYSFGMVQDLESQHRVSLSMRFNGLNARDAEFANKPKKKSRRIAKRVVHEREDVSERYIEETIASVERPAKKKRRVASSRRTLGDFERRSTSVRKSRKIYTVKVGDSLGKIARRYYGQPSFWKTIYNANKHIMDDPRAIEVGQKIILP